MTCSLIADHITAASSLPLSWSGIQSNFWGANKKSRPALDLIEVVHTPNESWKAVNISSADIVQTISAEDMFTAFQDSGF